MLCRVFIFSTATKRSNLEKTLVNHLVHAGLSFYIPDENTQESPQIGTMLRQEIEMADIAVFFVGTSLGSKKTHSTPLIEYAFDYADEIEKPILVYVTDELPLEPSAIQFREKITEKFMCGCICTNDNETSINVLNDIVRLVFSEQDLSYWTRADISRDDIEETISEIEELNRGLLRVDALIGEYEGRLEEKDRNILVGRLIDAGLRYNPMGKAHNFVVGCMPQRELQSNEFEYQYCLGRFAKHKSFREFGHGPVYDNMLNVSWFFIRKQPFTWNMAMNWQAYINDSDKNILQSIDKNALEQWQVPGIDQLMTLLSSNRCTDVYIDDTFFPNNTHWFWSSTKNETLDPPAAYYIETNHCQVLMDAIHEGPNAHYKGLLLCKPGQPYGKLLAEARARPNDEGVKQLKIANEAKKMFSVYVSVMTSDAIDPEKMFHIWQMLAKNGFIVSSPVFHSARNLPKDDFVQQDMSTCDFYVLIFNEVERRSKLDTPRVQKEIQFARDLQIPIWVFTNQNSEEYINAMKSMLEVNHEININYFDNIENLPHAIPMALNQYKNDLSILGWIKNHHFETINQGIDENNKKYERISNAKFYVEEFIQRCDVDGLRDLFEESHVLPPVLKYGVNTRFVSGDTPLQRLMINETATELELPILYTTFINRFELQPRNDDKRVVRDNLLNLYWWTDVNKHTTYEEALAWAEEISELDGRDWRLPTVDELVTIITAQRGTRKYMDEVVFHTGRWFWTGTRKHDSIYYVDFNYMPDAVRLEHLLPENEFPTIRKKSAILVSSVDQQHQSMNVFVSYATKDSGFVKDTLQELRTNQINFWEFREGLKPGMREWDSAVFKAMGESDAMLLIWSQAASVSKEVHNEWNYYLKTGHPIIILAYDSTELPYRLDLIQRINYKANEREKILQITRQSIKRLKK
jgi:hypothetical protein